MKRLLILLVSLALLVPATLMAQTTNPSSKFSPGGGPSLNPGYKQANPGRSGFKASLRFSNRPGQNSNGLNISIGYNRPGKWSKPGPGHYRPGQGPGKWSRPEYGYSNQAIYYPVWYPNYGLGYNNYTFSGLYGVLSYGYQNYDRVDYKNMRYINVAGIYGHTSGTDYRLRLYYDRLDMKDFPVALNELAVGVLGAVLVWPQKPEIVAHSAAVEKLFGYLDQKIQTRLAFAKELSGNGQRGLAYEVVRSSLAPLVDSITVEGGQYLVRFRLSNGSRSPWVLVPVVYDQALLASIASEQTNGNTNQNTFEGFRGTGSFEQAGPFYYDDPERGASLEAIKPDYDTASLYWKD